MSQSATLTIQHGWLPVGQRGTVTPNPLKVETRNETCTGLFVPDYWFQPKKCGYSFGVRASQIQLQDL